MVHTPVGVRCQDCAQVRRPPTFDVSRAYLARAIAAGVVVAIVGSTVVAIFMRIALPFFPLPLLAMVGVAYLVGEAVSLATNRKRGRTLKLVAAGSVLIVYVVFSNIFGAAMVSFYGFLAAAAAFYVAITRF